MSTGKNLRPQLSPQQRIMRAAKRGTGLRLTAGEVFRLSRDQAIEQCSENDDQPDEDEVSPQH